MKKKKLAGTGEGISGSFKVYQLGPRKFIAEAPGLTSATKRTASAAASDLESKAYAEKLSWRKEMENE